jgi:hypothetical protein
MSPKPPLLSGRKLVKIFFATGVKDKDTEEGGYPVRVKMLADVLKTKDGTVYRMKPGMSVTTEVNVGKRRVIEFFLFPVIRYLDEGLKVR